MYAVHGLGSALPRPPQWHRVRTDGGPDLGLDIEKRRRRDGRARFLGARRHLEGDRVRSQQDRLRTMGRGGKDSVRASRRGPRGRLSACLPLHLARPHARGLRLDSYISCANLAASASGALARVWSCQWPRLRQRSHHLLRPLSSRSARPTRGCGRATGYGEASLVCRS